MFGSFRNRMPATTKAESKADSSEAVRPQDTEPQAIALLEQKVREALAEAPHLAGQLTDADIAMATNHLALMQERTGVPYTVQSIQDFGEGLKEEIAASLVDRKAAKPAAGTHVVDTRGIVGSAGSMSEAVDRMHESREGAN
jgi:hypothetical protein